MPSAAASSAGSSRRTCARPWCSMRCGWRSASAGRAPTSRWCTTATAAPKADSRGRRNTLMNRGGDGPARWLDEGVDGPLGDEVAGQAVASTRGRAVVLAEIAKGLRTEDAAAAVGVSSAAGVRRCRERGGMATLLRDPETCRYLCFAEREEIALLRAEGRGVRAIAREIGRSPSTISRELRRNAATRGGKLEYRASVAQWKAELVARRPKTAKLAADPRLREYVQDRLAGQVRRPDGTAVTGPATAPWKGRNKPRRADRRWAMA